jgi:D-alanyl-D-alanine carboxypeptidase
MFRTTTRGVALAVCVTFFATLAQAQQYAALVMDARTGQVLHAANADTRLHPASLTKMMTLYIVFDEIRRGRMSLDQKVTISANAASEPPSKLGLRAGQQIEVRYLIRAAAIKSANDAATALGEAVAGSEAAFAQRMTLYAQAMGMTNTTFRNAHGLTAQGHLSSARDMAVLGRRLIYDYPQYYNIFSRNSTSAGIATVQNTNRRLLDAYTGADGIKTGYTRAAGFNLVSSAQRGNRRVIVSLFGGRSSASRNAEVARLMDLGFSRMPAQARVAALPPLQLGTAVAAAQPAAQSASTARGATVAATGGARQPQVAALTRSSRPMPRGWSGAIAVTRNTDSIAAAIAQVNAELAAQGSDSGGIPAAGRPRPRSGAGVRIAAAGSASTFAVAAPSAPAMDEPEPMTVADAGRPTTGGNAWGVQLGAYSTRGDAERKLLLTALKDLPELNGGLRRIETTKVRGATVYRAQFVGLTQAAATGACGNLQRQASECQPIAPGS